MPSHTTPALAALLTLPLALLGCSSADSAPDSSSSAGSSSSTSGASSSNATTNDSVNADSSVERLEANIIERLPFDDSLFTQGLEVTEAGEVLVGTGQYGESGLFALPVGSDTAQHHVSNKEDVFGEESHNMTVLPGLLCGNFLGILAKPLNTMQPHMSCLILPPTPAKVGGYAAWMILPR